MHQTRPGWLLPGLAAALLGAALPCEAATVVDGAEREVQVPAVVSRVFAAGPPASILLYTLAPETLLGWNRPPRPAEMPYIAPPFRDLPELGRLTGRADTANVEVVIAARPDLVLDYGSVRPTYVSLAERVQAQTGVPYLLLDAAFERIPETYRTLGAVLGRAERGERLARWAEDTLALAERLRRHAGEEGGPRVYYGRGPDGLETGLGGSINVELLERVGARNVVAEAGARGGLAQVSMEQILAWDPEVVLTLDERFYANALSDPLWARVGAVREGRVYLAPRLPFGWFDRPPSVNRLAGVHWLAHVLYPEVASDPVEQVAREFYRLFYHVDLGDAALEALLDGAREAGGR